MKYIKIAAALLVAVSLMACARGKVEESPMPETTPTKEAEATESPEATEEPKLENLPEMIDEGGESILNVYNIDTEKIEQMTLNDYLYGVLAGEMKNSWPAEALKAQAIIARTFLLDFLGNDGSTYENADISTDVKEAQAYNPEGINDQIKAAVDETDGMVIVYENMLIKSWFCSSAGGITATAKEGLSHKEDLPYIKSVESNDSLAPEDVQEWKEVFTKDQLEAALADMEEDIGSFTAVEIGEKGPSGRCITLKFGKSEIPCVPLRMALSASKFRSTLLTDISYENDKLIVSGKGFGHGVGMSQWGANKMAEDGKNAEEIINHYFNEISVIQAWDSDAY